MIIIIILSREILNYIFNKIYFSNTGYTTLLNFLVLKEL